jgi:signal peptidase I
MVPTLEVGQRVLVNRFSYRLGGDPSIGDVVVFHPPVGHEGDICGIKKPERRPGQACAEPTPEMAETNFIKRVVAEPGDRLRIEDGIPIVNGEPVNGDWETRPCRGLGSCDYPEEITIPPDHYFMMGDNRGSSQDSRFWGPVPRDWIIGEAFFTYWPPKRIGIL